MGALGILSEQEVRDAINWEVYITIAAAFGIGTALVNSGVAGGVADFLVTIGTSIGTGGTFQSHILTALQMIIFCMLNPLFIIFS
jgi:di/tricarboxylate transporter